MLLAQLDAGAKADQHSLYYFCLHSHPNSEIPK